MTVDKFIKSIEQYYGEYENNFVLACVKRYLQDFTLWQLDILYFDVLRTCSYYKEMPPDIAMIEKAAITYKTREQVNNANNILITDSDITPKFIEEQKKIWSKKFDKKDKKNVHHRKGIIKYVMDK